MVKIDDGIVIYGPVINKVIESLILIILLKQHVDKKIANLLFSTKLGFFLHDLLSASV